MNLNITHTLGSFQFENKENLKQSAQNILSKQGASNEVAEKIINQTIFNATNSGINAQIALIHASKSINTNNNLKETLKYLKSNATKKSSKLHVFGEIWDDFYNDEDNKNCYNEELFDFVINLDNNIFAAA